MMKRTAILIYGVASYGIFFATFLYLIAFLGNFLVPITVDGTPTASLGVAIAINVGLIAIFGVQHSVMARPWFKRWWTRIIPEAAERSTYVLLSSVALIVLYAFWEPMGGMIWSVENTAGHIALYTICGAGWALVLYATFLLNHFDLFGLRQVWLEFRNRPYTPLKFDEPALYKMVRHPLYVGWLMAFWGTPTMSATHLVFALTSTAYILTAIPIEERDLIGQFGDKYVEYRKRVPALIPFTKRKTAKVVVTTETGIPTV